MAASAPPGGTPRTLADGETVAGRYQVRRFIARGGMGEVYEAFDSALGETIALKTIIVTAVDQTDAVRRLLAEVRIAARSRTPTSVGSSSSAPISGPARPTRRCRS